jgi:hypothetical protein
MSDHQKEITNIVAVILRDRVGHNDRSRRTFCAFNEAQKAFVLLAVIFWNTFAVAVGISKALSIR